MKQILNDNKIQSIVAVVFYYLIWINSHQSLL